MKIALNAKELTDLMDLAAMQSALLEDELLTGRNTQKGPEKLAELRALHEKLRAHRWFVNNEEKSVESRRMNAANAYNMQANVAKPDPEPPPGSPRSPDG